MKLLLLSVKAGYGHHSTALAIKEYFEDNGHECCMLDIFEYINPHLADSIQNGYLMSTKYTTKAYGWIYGLMAKKTQPYSSHSAVISVSKFVANRIGHFVEEFSPDLVISTHSYAAICSDVLSEKGYMSCPSIGIVTDFTVHPFWESTSLDYYVIPDRAIIPEMEEKGIEKSKILPLGIPVRKPFTHKSDKTDARRKLGLDNMPTVLLMMGSMGYGNIKKILGAINNCPQKLQLLCVCGSNEKFKKTVDEFEWMKPVYSYGFVNNVDVMMDASDFIISKPGGLTTSEALAKGLPMIAVNPIPGHEVRNMKFLAQSGAALGIGSKLTMSDALFTMLSDPQKIALMREKANAIGKPASTANLYNFACEKFFTKSASIRNSLPIR